MNSKQADYHVEPESKVAIGSRLRELLYWRHLKASDLARITSNSNPRISAWLHGKALTVDNLVCIAEMLNVSLNWLVLGIGQRQSSELNELTPVEENLVKVMRHYGPEPVDAINRFLGVFEDTRQDSRLTHFRAHDLMSRLRIPVLMVNYQGELLASSPAFFTLMGLDQRGITQLTGTSYKDWTPKELHASLRKLIRETTTVGHARSDRLRVISLPGVATFDLLILARLFETQQQVGVQMNFIKV